MILLLTGLHANPVAAQALPKRVLEPLAPSVTLKPAMPVQQAVPRTEVAPKPAAPVRKHSPESLEDCYRLKADVGFAHLPAELIVLPDRQPLALRASVEQTSASLPRGLRELSRKFSWHADAGQLTPAADSKTSAGWATLTLPPDSRPVSLRAELQVRLLKREANGSTRTLELRREAVLRVLTPVPSSQVVKGVIDGYKIGKYPDPKRMVARHLNDPKYTWFVKNEARYRPPEYYYKVTPAIRDLKIAPHQTLGFWMIDFPWCSLGQTQYVALDSFLVRKLEDLLDLMRAGGVPVTHFVPIYGFRPPAFNEGTREAHPNTTLKVTYSMHQYGRAIDLIVDENNDAQMDDLNHDGKSDIDDAMVIMRYVNKLDGRYKKMNEFALVGGAGTYTHHDFTERPVQSPYIHIDTRGFVSDAGYFFRWSDLDKKTTSTRNVAIAGKPAKKRS